MKMELRFIESELRVNPDGTMVVSGYVNKTGQLSEVLGSARKFREKFSLAVLLEQLKGHREILIF